MTITQNLSLTLFLSRATSAMASSPSSLFPFFKTLTLLSLLSHLTPAAAACFTSIVSFGDSLTDTGNFLHALNGTPNRIGHSPYGETYFHRPTGRYSDGRIILDFIAEAIGLPFVPPFLGGVDGGDFRRGVNFAVGGATAIESSFFWERGIEIATNFSLGVQVEWFKQLLPSLCPDCEEFLAKTLFIVGEIGGNDYSIPLLAGGTVDEAKTFVLEVNHAIGSAINDLIELGAKTLVVPGYLSFGCMPSLLTVFQSIKQEDYDSHTGCIKWIDEFTRYLNQKLIEEIDHLRELHPSATIIYADYYGAMMMLFDNPHRFGFGEKYLSACCGAGGPYNYDSSAECGTEKASACSDPSKFISWDGVHLTEAACRVIVDALIKGPFSTPQIKESCLMRSGELNYTDE